MIETKRLLLREYTRDDFDSLYEIMSDAETMQHYPANELQRRDVRCQSQEYRLNRKN